MTTNITIKTPRGLGSIHSQVILFEVWMQRRNDATKRTIRMLCAALGEIIHLTKHADANRPSTQPRRKTLCVTYPSSLALGLCIIVTQGLYLVNGTLPAFGSAAKHGVVVGHVDYRFSLHMLHAAPPVSPVVLTSDQEPDQHTRVHLTDMESTQSSCVA